METRRPLSILCEPGTHCATCRDYTLGRAWRATARRTHDVSVDDFACPLGKAWDYRSAQCPTCGGLHTGGGCPIPADFDAEKERLRLQQGGCCNTSHSSE